MIANYGYQDGSGDYFITIDTDKCIECEGPCVTACPGSALAKEENDYDEEVAVVAEEHRTKIKDTCAPCKPKKDRPALPCVSACPFGAITHSW